MTSGSPRSIPGPERSGAPVLDALGTWHGSDSQARIVCLVPSLTELLCALGLAAHLVGRTGYCIHPEAQVRAIPKVGGTKDVNIEKIRRLAPTHLIVNVDENEKPTVDMLAGFVPHVVVTHPQTPRDNLDLYRLFGALFCARPQAEALCRQFESALAAMGPPQAPARRVLYLIWKDPWMTVAPHTYIGNMLALVGWQQIAVTDDARYPRIELDALAREADLVLLSSEPFRFTELDRKALHAELAGPAVLLVDAEMISWYGSRAISGLSYLAGLARSAPS